MEITKAWVTPAPNVNEVAFISFRVPKRYDGICKVRLDRYTDFAECIKNNEVHYNIGMLSIEALIKIRDAINEYIIKYNNGEL